ncbi:unnamed protein product [Polarella glacialis]|uniref:Uncharacterized protein n=1 Tax=Polarella glacialis TaxID=89957 RepID=A0A813K5D8_POLGL|nr:unnamed protein product [Polarella glacialis]|mmetsp:Transcript_15646/g.27804  ORF Transcript_15646/g.27804 Transcript_15646/m.27804 type:complete len:120 (-) Transcript_15646:36-395(-)
MGFSEDPGMCAKYCSCRKHGTDEIAALREKALVLTSAPRYVEGMGGGSNLFTTKMLACLRGERATVSLHQLKECVYEGVLGEFSLLPSDLDDCQGCTFPEPCAFGDSHADLVQFLGRYA